MTQTTQVSVAELIAGCLAAGEVDPRVIADKVRPALSDDQRDEMVYVGLVTAARDQIGRLRSLHVPVHAAKPSQKWAGVSAASRDPRVWPVTPTGRQDGWKPLGECTEDEVRALAALCGLRAESNARSEERYRALADEMARRRARTVSKLPLKVVEALMLS